jgi:hypothetical protein
MTAPDAMSKQKNPFREIRRNHENCVLIHLALAAFNSTTYRIFGKGSGKKIREFVVSEIGDGRRLASCRDFESEHAELVNLFPSGIHLNANSKHRKPGFGHKAKVIDLYLKTLYCQREPLNAAAAKRLGQRLHVPLDNIVLESVWSEFSHKPEGRKRAVLQLDGKDVAKSDLSLAKLSEEHYLAVQRLLASHAKKAGTIAILYDDRYTEGSEQART